jgi:hypothetical protein
LYPFKKPHSPFPEQEDPGQSTSWQSLPVHPEEQIHPFSPQTPKLGEVQGKREEREEGRGERPTTPSVLVTAVRTRTSTRVQQRVITTQTPAIPGSPI